MEEQLKKLAVELFEIDALKFGTFDCTNANMSTSVYFDLRVIVSHPRLMKSLSSLLWKFSKSGKSPSHICGVPYTALPLATLISVEAEIPMLVRRKEAKTWGTKKLIEGQFRTGETCIIIEDVVATGISVLQTVQDLKKEGLMVDEVYVVLDRGQGGRRNLEANGIQVKSLYTLNQLMGYLLEAGKVTANFVQDVKDYLKQEEIDLDEYIRENTARLEYNQESTNSVYLPGIFYEG